MIVYRLNNVCLKGMIVFLATAVFISLISCDGLITSSTGSSRIIVQNYYWAKPGLEEEVYQQRILASRVREKYGHPVGRILRLRTASDSLPDVIWECEYPGLKAREKDVDRLMQNEEFGRVADKMATLLEKFDRAVYEVTVPETVGE